MTQIRALASRARRELGSTTDPQTVTLPPYYPRDPVLLEDWAAYLDSVRLTDLHVGRLIDRLKREGLLDNTLIIFMTDHGISHARGKQFLYEYAQDRGQLTNLADSPEHRATLETLRARLDRWIIDTKDHGPEPMDMYDSDMAEYLKKPEPAVQENITLMKRWAAEGK